MRRRPPAHPDTQWQQEAARIHPGLPPGWLRMAAELHEGLLRRWLGRLPVGARVLKTDLFEEALSPENPCARIDALGWRPLGMDVGLRIARAAARCLAGGPARVLVTDARAIALRTGSIDAVFSNSTLDHFTSAAELDRALGELYRVLKPGGRLLLTLDNPVNPLIGVRNWLPRRLTEALRITRFHVGHTLGLRAAEARLRALGFEIQARGTLMHAVRYLALPLLRLTHAAGWRVTEAALLRLLLAAEALGRWPTAQLTGHFIFLEAVKPAATSIATPTRTGASDPARKPTVAGRRG